MRLGMASTQAVCVGTYGVLGARFATGGGRGAGRLESNHGAGWRRTLTSFGRTCVAHAVWVLAVRTAWCHKVRELDWLGWAGSFPFGL
jgi:hypothetical protein